MGLFEKKHVEVMPDGSRILTPREEQRDLMVQEVRGQVTAQLGMNRSETDSIERIEQVIPPAVTRFIDLVEKNEKTGQYEVRKDSFGNPIDIMGALGNIPAAQMPYMQIGNMNHIAITLEEDCYLSIYEKDAFGMAKIGADGKPILIYRNLINLGQETQVTQLLNNLAYEYRTAKLQGQVMVGNAGGSPLGVGGDWNDTLGILFGGGKKK